LISVAKKAFTAAASARNEPQIQLVGLTFTYL
jgi:hypothetical protein